MRRIAWLPILFLWPSLTFAQGVMAPPQIALKTVNGVTMPIANATITVCAANASGIPCAPALVGTIFKDATLTQALSNPFTSDASGNYQFAAAPGNYTVTVTASGYAGYSYPVTLSAPGNAAIKPAASDGIRYVSPNGSSSNDGESWGSALWGTDAGAAVNAAYAALPAAGGVINVAAGSFNYSTPIVIATPGKPVRITCGSGAGASNTTPQSATIFNFTPTSGIAISISNGSGNIIENGCSFTGAGSSTPIGMALGGNPTGSFIESSIKNLQISGFPGCGIELLNNVYIDSFYDLTVHDNAGKDFCYPSSSTGGGESLKFFGGVFAESGSTMAPDCVNIAGSTGNTSFYGTSFDQCGVTVNNITGTTFSMYQPNFENPNGASTVDFLTISGTGNQDVNIFSPSIFEDSVSSGRTELVNVSNTGTSVVAISGGLIVPAEAIADCVKVSSSNVTFVSSGVRSNGNCTAFSSVSSANGQGLIASSLSLPSSGGGSVTHQAPNTASNFTQTDTPLSGSTVINITGSVSIASGFGTSPSIVNQGAGSGPTSIEVNVGTGGTATSGVLTMPSAPNGWSCPGVTDMNTNIVTRETAFTATSVTLTAASAWTASDKLLMTCWPF